MTEAELKRMADAISEYDNQLEERIARVADSLSHEEELRARRDELRNIALGDVRSAVQYGDVIVVQHLDYKWGVIATDGSVIVPFGKYGWIDGFDSGLARVRTHGKSGTVGNIVRIISDDDDTPDITGKENIQKYIDKDRIEHPERYAKWGIINEEGEEVLP